MKHVLSALCCFVSLMVAGQQSHPITFTHAGKTVYGTFTTPDGPGPFPTIIINPGSGPNDRDGTLPLSGGNVPCLYPELNGETLKPYKELADALVDSGYAVLRYDKLEFTYPTTLGTITFHKLWLPVESAIAYVKTRADVDTNRLILIGHSEGSALIPFIAKTRTDISALISIAGARTPFDSILARQLVEFERLCNGDTLLAKAQAGQILEYFGYVRNGACGALPPLFGVPGCVWEDYTNATDPVAEHYNDANLPTLFLGLGLDINVPLTELERFESEVTVTDDFWRIPDVVHYMTPHDDPHVSEILTDTIVYWLRQHHLHTRVVDAGDVRAETVLISPNPFRDEISLVFNAGGDGVITIMDSTGKVVINKSISGIVPGQAVKLDVHMLPAGQYILQVNGENLTVTHKIMKQ